MKRVIVRMMPILVAFAAGVGVGVFADAFSCRRADLRCGDEEGNSFSHAMGTIASTNVVVSTESDDSFSHAMGTIASTEETASTIEVVVDSAPAPSSEIAAAHAARQARRRVAREAREKNRRDFLSELNLELLSDQQRETHQLFLEALAVRDETAAEIRRRRAAGEDVPEDLQTKLADAQSVLRTDHDAELRILREAAARAAGLDETAVRQLAEDLDSIDGVIGR